MTDQNRKVSVRDSSGEIVARVRYNENLDYHDGRNWTCGETGRHLGLTRLRKTGEYVLIHGSQWQGDRDYGVIVDEDQALQEIMRTENIELLDLKIYADLKKLYERNFANAEMKSGGGEKKTKEKFIAQLLQIKQDCEKQGKSDLATILALLNFVEPVKRTNPECEAWVLELMESEEK